MDTYEKQMEDLCRDMVMYHLMKNGMDAREAFQEYKANPSLRAEVEGIASIHVGKMIHKEEVSRPAGLKDATGAIPLGNGRYRLTSPNRSAISGRFNRKR